MANEQNPQTPTAQGYVVLPDGRTVPTVDTWFNQQANNPQGFGAEQQRTQLSQGYRNYVAEPVTNALGDFISTNPISKVAEATGLLSPETNKAISHGIASVTVPQNLTQAGVMAGVLAGGLGAAAAPAGFGPALRVMGGTAGGAAGGYAETGTTRGALTGSGQGLVQAGIGESAGTIWNYARGIGPERVRSQMHDLHASEVAKVIKTNPRLKGAFANVEPTQAGLEDLVKGYVTNPVTKRATAKGQALLSAQMEQADQQIGAAIQQQAQNGVNVRFPLVTEKTPGQWGTWADARTQLSDLGAIAGAAKPHMTYTIGGQTMNGAEVKQLYASSLRGFQQQLNRVGPEALTAFNDARATYETGQYYLKMIEEGFKRKGAQVEFNSGNVQKALSKTQRSRAEGVNRLGEQEYWRFSEAAGVPRETPGTVDIYKPGGFLYNTTRSVPGLGGVAPYVARPNLVNPAPLALSQAQRTGVNVMGSQMSAPVAQYLANQTQGIPGLGR